jgi:hypothetical protein
MARSKKKLELDKRTLRTLSLDRAALAKVAGGDGDGGWALDDDGFTNDGGHSRGRGTVGGNA